MEISHIFQLFLIILIFSILKLSINRSSKIWIISFLGIWLVVQFLSSLNLYGLIEVETYTYLIINLFITFYVFGFFVNINKLKVNSKKINFKILISNYNNSKIIYFINFAVTSIVILYLYKYIIFMIDAPLSDSRKARFYTGFVFKNGVEQILFNTVLSVFVNVQLLISVIALHQKTAKPILILLSVFTAIGWNGFGGGRFDILILIFMFMFSVMLFGNLDLIKNKLILVFIFISLLIFVVFISSFRSGGASNFELSNTLLTGFEILLEQLITYFNGALIALQYSVEAKEKFYYPGYGMFLFSGLDELLSLPLNYIGFNIEPFNYNYSEKLNENIHIGNGFEFNALYTGIFYPFMDLNLLGVIVVAFVLGYFSFFSLYKTYSNKNIGYLVIAWILYISSMLTPVVFKLTSPDVMLMLALSILSTFICRKKK
jgi:oligosaccharide repeat unit polymerase